MPSILDLSYAKKNYGTAGRQCPVKSNFATIEITKNIIYHYTIEINIQDRINNEDDKNRNQQNRIKAQKKLINKINFEIFERFLNENKTIIKSEPVFDGKQNIYSTTEIELNGNRKDFQIKMKLPGKKFLKTFNIILIKQDKINLKDTIKERELQALTVIVNYGIKHFNLVLNSNIFPKFSNLLNERRDVMENINFDIGDLKEGRFGHHSSVKLTENGLQLCIDRSASVFNKGGSIIKIIKEFCENYRGKNNQNNRGTFNRGNRNHRDQYNGINNRGNRDQYNGRNNQDSRGSYNRDNRNYRDQYKGGLKGNSRYGNRDEQQDQGIKIDRNFKLDRHELGELNKLLRGLEFEVNHINSRPKFTINEITSKSVSEITFKLKNKDNKEEEISVKKYYERAYPDCQLLGNLPCVQVGKINPTFYPLEVVEICYDQYSRKKLNSTQQAIMTRKCGSQNPISRFQENESKLRNLIECSSKCQNDFLRSFGIRITKNFNTFNGRILDVPSLISNGRQFEPTGAQWRPENGNGFEVKFNSIINNFKWGVINIRESSSRPLDRRDVDKLIETLIKSSKQNGIDLKDPNFVEYEVQVDCEGKEIENLIKWASKKDTKFILFLIPNSDILYNKIKFISECEEGIVTQCISQSKNRQFNNMAYCGNVVLKINSKLGGINTVLEEKHKVGFLGKKTMIMGFDVNNGSKGSKDQNQYSIASIVGSYDRRMVNYHSVKRIQEKDHNEIVNLDIMVKELLDKFKNERVKKYYPDNVVVYRDGVNDGQFQHIMSLEIAAIKKAFRELNQPTNKCDPKLTYIVCQKGHNTRFLPRSERDALKSGNVKPGLVVDRNIVSNFNEFYLCSHFGALGTSRPTRYTVLYDDAKLKGDEIQQATYNLSFLFPRCLKATSIVPPILYAGLSSKRARSYISCLDEKTRLNIGNFDLLSEQEKTRANSYLKVRENLEGKLYFI